MTSLETAARKAIATLRMRYRVTEIPAADDEAVATILGAAEPNGRPALVGEAKALTGYAAGPDTELAGQVAATDAQMNRLAELESLLAEVLGAFKRNPNGWNARAKLELMEQWRERLGDAT